MLSEYGKRLKIRSRESRNSVKKETAVRTSKKETAVTSTIVTAVMTLETAGKAETSVTVDTVSKLVTLSRLRLQSVLRN